MSNIAILPNAKPTPLANPEAEAALLGALLIENRVADLVSGSIASADFHEPVHARIFSHALSMIEAGKTASPVTLRPSLDGDDDLRQLGGLAYLARLTGDGQGLLAPRDLAEQIRELAIRRRRLQWLDAERAACVDATAPLRDVAPPSDSLPAVTLLPLLDLAALASVKPEPKAFIIPRLAPAGEVTLFTGAGAVGKSLLAQQLATAIAAGATTLGLAVAKAPAIYMTCEDDPAQLHFRQAAICRMLGVPMADLAGALHLSSLRGQPDNALAAFDDNQRLVAAPLYHRVAGLIRSTKAELVCLDNVAHLFPGNENDRGEVTQFVNLLNRLAGETGAAIILLGHPNKGGDTYSGSTAWLNAVRSQVTMERPQGADHDPDLRAIHIGKPNYTAAGEALRCRWSDWAFIRDEDMPEDKRAELSRVIAASAENEAFLACLRERAAQGDSRAVGPNAGANFAPAQFEGMPAARGFSKTALKNAMERLFTIGAIEAVSVRNTSKGRDVTVIREVQSSSPNAPRTLFGQKCPEAVKNAKNVSFMRDTHSPNATPNDSRTHFPDDPERTPNATRTIPERTTPPTGECVGAPDGGPHTSPRGERGQP